MQCSTARLQSALAGSLSAPDETALHEHLDACDQCSAALEQLAGGPAWCRETAALLGPDDLDDSVPTRDEWSEIDFTVEHLEPSDEPGVLGRLGGYDVLEIIGHGGMGVVLKAFDRELKRTVAIKVLAPHLARTSLARKRFAREAQAAAAVVHPHVLAIHQVQATGRLPFLVMPLVAGESLAERLTAQGTLELKETLRIGMQAAAGLAAAHEQGLVHRDVKPANILLEKGVERAVLTDFGLARAADDVTLTRWGVVAGTPQYMSPEQARGEPLDGRSDLFSLGCVLYEMATGVSPFRTDSPLATMRRLIEDSPQAMESLNPELPPWLIAIVERLLEKDPARRFNSAAEVSDLLENCLAHVQRPAAVPLPEQLRNLPTSTSAKRGRWSLKRLVAGAVAALAILLASVVIVLELNKGTLTIESVADDVALRITQGDRVVEKLTVTRAGEKVRIAAGKYDVEIEGEATGIAVEDGNVTIKRGGADIVRIVQSNATRATESKRGAPRPDEPPSLLPEIPPPAPGTAQASPDVPQPPGVGDPVAPTVPSPNRASKTRGPGGLGFSEITEVVLSHSTGVFLDLDTGQTIGEAQTPRPEERPMDIRVMQDQTFHDPTGLTGQALQGMKVNPRDWDATAAEVSRAFANKANPRLTKMELTPSEPATYFFKTRDGAAGILQIVGLVNNPKGIHVRYKTVQLTRDEPPSAASFEAAARIASEVAARIEQLKSKYRHLEKFSATEHFKKAREDSPASELYFINYTNGTRAARLWEDPPKEVAEELESHGYGRFGYPSYGGKPAGIVYDPQTGIALSIRFTRKQPVAHYQKGEFSVYVQVSGPAAKQIRGEVRQILESLGAEFKFDPSEQQASSRIVSPPRDRAEFIAQLVAGRIEELKSKFPHLENFSAAEHLKKNEVKNDFAPGTASNPELYSISFHHGVAVEEGPRRSGPRRTTTYVYDKHGIQLHVHFFKGDTRGNDPTPPIRIGDLSIHVHVNGPAAERIGPEIVRILESLGAQIPAGADLQFAPKTRRTKDLARLQGTWEAEVNSGKSKYTVVLTFDGNSFTEVHQTDDGGRFTIRGDVTLDESANPKQITQNVSNARTTVGWRFSRPTPLRPIKSTYSIDDEVLTIRRTGESAWPKEFQTAPDQVTFYRRPESPTANPPSSPVRLPTRPPQPSAKEATQPPGIATEPGPNREPPSPLTPTVPDAPLPNSDRPADASSFSETKELVLYMGSSKFMLDLDSGATIGAPARADRAELGRMDVHATQMQPSQYPTCLSGAPSSFLSGQPMRGMKVKSSQWNASAAEVRRALAGDDVPPLTQMDYKPLEPATYFFKTEAGADGILELMSLVEDPKGIRIRYKTVTRSADQTAPAPSPGKTTDSPPAYPKPTSPSPYRLTAESIAEKVAAHIDSLKTKFPHLEKFSAAEHLRKNTDRDGQVPAPGTPGNPELYSISYHNGATRRLSPPTSGPKRAAEYDYDPKAGIRLNIHVFKGRSRGNDLSVPYQIGDLSVHVHVNGPAAVPIRAEIVRLLASLGAKLGLPANTPEAPRESPRPAHPPTSSGDGNQPSPSSAPDAAPTVPAPPTNDSAGEPSRGPPAPTPPTAAAPPASNDSRANSAGFSQPKELVLSMNSSKFMLDLDTGETMDPPARIRPEQAKMDLSTTQVQPYHYPTGLVGHSFQGTEVKAGDWNASVDEVRRGLAGNIYALKEMDVGPEKNPTYFFKTRDGALGILQLVEVTDEPKGIRLRYKTVLRGSAAEKSAGTVNAVSEEAPSPKSPSTSPEPDRGAPPSSQVSTIPKPAHFQTRDNVNRIATSADGKLIAVANGNPTFILRTDGTSRVKDNWKPWVEILEANTGASVRVISPETSPTVSAVLDATRRVNHIEVTALAFSPVEEVIAVGTSIGQVLLFNSRTGMLLNSLDDKEPRLADKETPENWEPLQRAMGSVGSIAFSPDGSLLAVCGNSFEDFSDVFDGIEQLRRRSTAPGRLKVFAVNGGALKHDLAGHSHAFDVAFSTDGSLLASAGRWDGGNDPGNGVLVWNQETGEKMRTILIEANGGTHRVAFSPNQKLIATGSEHYDKENDTSSTSIAVMYPLSGSREWQRVVPGWSKLEFVPDGTALAVLSGGQSIQYLDVSTGQTKQEAAAPLAPPGARLNDFAVAHKGRKLAVGGIDANRRGLVFVWPTGEGPATSP